MFGVREYLIATLLVLVLALGAALWLALGVVRDSKEKTNVAVADTSAAEAYVNDYKKVTHEAAVRKQRTEEVLAANREWADEPVPAAVADLLRDRGDASGEVP